MVVSQGPLTSVRARSRGRVTIIIPCFNAEATIEFTVASVINQEGIAEVLIVDDGSTDETHSICEKLQRQHPAIRVLRHRDGKNNGVAASRNLGIAAATTPFVSFLDADDCALPDRFGTPLALLDQAPEVDGVYEAVGMIQSEKPEPDSGDLVDPPLLTLNEAVPPDRFLGVLLAPGTGSVHTNGFVLRREVFRRIGNFDSSFQPAEEMHLFWRLAAACRLVPGRLDRPVAIYRRHAGSLSNPNDPVYLDDPFRRALDLVSWSRNRSDVSRRNRVLLKRILVHNIAAWWGEPIPRLQLRMIQLRRWFQAARVAPSVLAAPKIWLAALGLKKDPVIKRDHDLRSGNHLDQGPE